MNSAEMRKDSVLLGQVTPHILQHTYCTQMAESGVDIKILQNLMGHKTLEMTMQIYNHVNVERIGKSVDNYRKKVKL